MQRGSARRCLATVFSYETPTGITVVDTGLQRCSTDFHAFACSLEVGLNPPRENRGGITVPRE